MDEKTLIKSVMDEKAKNIFRAITSAFLALSGFILIILAVIKPVRYSYYGNTYYSSGFKAAFRGKDECIIALIAAGILLIAGIVLLIIYLALRKCELTITDKNVKGKTLFGKEVVLPLYMVSAYSTKKLFSTIAIATSSGITKFALIGNYAEIGTVLSQKINERQENTTTNEVKTTSAQSSSIDDLIKLKSLLDSGIISEEEFNAKKKQILGL